MSKKAILSALLVSSALLGATAANAATSDIKAESKKVTVCTDKAKLYKDSKLKESTTPKNGTVYQVDGYRNIDGKHVYRVYQTDKDGKKAYRGYIDSKDTKDFNAEKAKGQFVLNGKANVWKNFYWTEKDTNTAERVVFAKYEYTLGNGAKYYSVYSKDAEGKEVWQGYTSKSNLKEVTSTKESKYVALKKDTKSYANLYFQQTKGNFDVKSGVNFKVTRYYTIDGKKYYSTEQAKGAWTGYVDSSVVEDLTAEKVAAADSKVQVEKDWNTYSDHFYTKKAKLADYKGKDLTAKYVYTYGNGKKYASLYDGDTWVGYANVEALKFISDDVTSANIEDLQNAIKDAQEVVKNDADLTGVDKVKDALAAAEKVLADAKKGNATQAQINDAVKNIQDAIKAVKVDKADLEKEIKEIEALAKNVYLTKDQEDQLNKTLADVQKVADDLSQENIDAVKKAQQTLVKAKEELQKQPTATEGKALNDALQKAQKLDKYGDVLFQNFGLVKATYNDAEQIMNELKKDSDKGNTATTPLTAADVKKVTDALNDALNNLQINAENTKWFYNQAKGAIAKLDSADQDAANKALQAFVDVAKKGTAKNFKQIVEAANNLVNAINDAQNKELKAAIDKANEIIKENDAAKPGNQGTNEDFYTEKTFNALKEAVAEAQKALDLKVSDIHKDNMYDKQTTKVALNNAIKGLQIAHWKYTEQDGKIILTEYIPLAINGNQKAANNIIYRQDKIVIPGKLKGKSVELDIQTVDNYLYPIVKSGEKTSDGKTINGQKVPVTFKEVDGQKVTTGKQLDGTFAYMGTIDVSGLDTSNAESFASTFKGNTSATIKGIENLNTAKGKNFGEMFSSALSISSLDLSKWNMESATTIKSMFFNTPKLTNLNLSGWKLTNISDSFPQSKVFGSKDTLEGKDTGSAPKYNSFCGVIHINSKVQEGKDRVWIDGLTFPTDSHAKKVIDMALDQSITGDFKHTKPTKK
ncbi:BspA family leucine-rich repeat surface protein [Catellicoccus marimammalium]|uniref:Surface protein n=1 Tax=Catellicoccus marimammalium M35/04/3 TaxID=1234409 RepID=K8ZK62_9ENTE|nr:BspA family leucine-rich repeat surface protein [Catellicoccus marimammalium]EKU26978.1 hypothetical protein C683_0974 [Catellicoccus marimammalium M35/04/3]